MGVVLNFHYCGGDLETVALYHADEDDCCGDEAEKNCSCCADKFISVDTDDSEKTKTVVHYTNFVKKIALKYQLAMINLSDGYRTSDNVIPINHAPPNTGPEPLFIKNCIMRI